MNDASHLVSQFLDAWGKSEHALNQTMQYYLEPAATWENIGLSVP